MLTIKLDSELHQDFMAEAQAMDRPASQLLREMMRDFVKQRRDARDYDVWFRAEVEAGLREVDDPNVELVPHQEVVANLARRRDALLKRLSQNGK